MSASRGGRHLDPRVLAEGMAGPVTPWSGDQLVGLLVANGVGLVLVFVGWWEASGLSRANDQLAWLNLAVVGLVVAGGANGLWLARGRRAVRLARAAVLPYPRGALSPWSGNGRVASGNGQVAVGGHRPVTVPARRVPGGSMGAGGLVAGPAMSMYHRADCLLAVGKEVRVAGRADHERAGRRPCEVCLP